MSLMFKMLPPGSNSLQGAKGSRVFVVSLSITSKFHSWGFVLQKSAFLL